MSEQFQIALLGALMTIVGLVVTGIGVLVWYKFTQIDDIKDGQARTAVETATRLTTNEVELRQVRRDIESLHQKAERWFVLTSAAALHSPSDHLGADKELERFTALYEKHNGDMPYTDDSSWQYWRTFFDQKAHHPDANSTERLAFHALVELCNHKLTGGGMLSQLGEPEASAKIV